jgi:outer membrane protein TolC
MTCSLVFSAGAQLSVEACQAKARANYPQIKQFDLIKQSEAFTLSNAGKAYLPQLSLSAKATYQSDVTKIPINIPGVKGMSKDQYQAVAEANQLVWDGGAVSAQKQVTRASSEVDRQRVEVDLYALNDRVNQLFFGILSLNEQLVINELLDTELTTNYNKISAYVGNGVANEADLDNIRVEQLNNGQRRVELLAARKAYLAMLSALTGETISDPSQLTPPQTLQEVSLQAGNRRPEMTLFDAQANLFQSQRSRIDAANMPKISLFVQGGYGRPGLNMLDNTFSPFYIGGVRLAWNFGALYTRRNDLKIIETNRILTDVQRETFLFNSHLKEVQQQTEIDKLQQLVKTDEEIIRLRHNVKLASEAKVANGTLSVSDLIRDINAESQARQNKQLHEVQQQLAIYNLKNTINN